jgi:hypothetical protein
MKEDLQIDYDTTLFDQCIKDHTGIDLSNIRRTTKSTDLAIQAVDKTTRTWQEQVPKEYHRFGKIFDEMASHRFPPKCPWDHAIDLCVSMSYGHTQLRVAVLPNCSVFLLSIPLGIVPPKCSFFLFVHPFVDERP